MKNATVGPADVHPGKMQHRARLRNTGEDGDRFEDLMALIDPGSSAMEADTSEKAAEHDPLHVDTQSSAGATQPAGLPNTIIPLLRRAWVSDPASERGDDGAANVGSHVGLALAKDGPFTIIGSPARQLHRSHVIVKQQSMPMRQMLAPDTPSSVGDDEEPRIEVLSENCGSALEVDVRFSAKVIEQIPPASAAVSAAPATNLTAGSSTSDKSPAHQILATLAETIAADGQDHIKSNQIKVFRIKLRPEELGDVEIVLRHTSQETRIRISVNREAAAEALRRDVSLLEDRIGPLLATNASRSVTIAVQAGSQTEGTAFPSEHGGSGSTGFGAQADGREQRSSPDKQGPAYMRNTAGKDDQALSLQSSSAHRRVGAGLVV